MLIEIIKMLTITSKMFKITIKNIFAGIIILFTIFFITLCSKLWTYYNLSRIDISCHYLDNNNVVPELGEGYKMNPRSVFFHETTCAGNLTPRQACSVESAARADPDWDINVLFSGPLSEQVLKHGSLKELHGLKNVKLLRVNIKEYAIGTPLEGFILGGALNKSEWKVEHTSDVLRYLTLYKWGGVYMDLDVVVARSLSSLARNWAARESDLMIANGLLAFSQDAIGRKAAETVVKEVVSDYRGDSYSYNGPRVITRALKKICSTDDPLNMSSATCNGFEVYAPQIFFPVNYKRSKEYFEPGDLDVKNVYIYHTYNHVTKECKIHKDSPYAKLAKRYCPTIFKIIAEDENLRY